MVESDIGNSAAMVPDNQPQPDPPTTGNHSSHDDGFADAGIAVVHAQSRAADRISREVDAEKAEYKAPDIAYQIDPKLYTKAAMQNGDLTDDERTLLLTRGDVFGKALAHPESLTAEEMYQVMYWPPPDVLHATIQKVTGGTLNRPSELIAKAREATERGRLQEDLNDDEVQLITQTFRDKPPKRFIDWGNDGCPGNTEAESLVCTRLGVDVSVIRAVRIHQARERKGGDAYVDAVVISIRQLQGRLERGEIGNDEFMRLNRSNITSLRIFMERGGGDTHMDAIVNSMTHLQERLEHGEVEKDELITLSRGYVNSLRTLRESRRQAQARPASTSSDIGEVPIVEDEEEDRVDAIAKSMMRLQKQLGRGEVERDEFIRANRDYITSLKTLREGSGGDSYLDAIVTSMTRLQERFDRDEADTDEYIRLNWGYVIPLSTFRENRRHSRNAGGGPSFGKRPQFPYRDQCVRLFWCDHYAEFAALNLSPKNLAIEVYKQWDALSKDQKEAYEARARTIEEDQVTYALQLYPWAKLG